MYLPFSETAVAAVAKTEYDRGPFGNDGATEGNVVVNNTVGKYGSGARLPGGTADIIRVTNSTSLQFTDLITVEAWIFPNTDGAAFHPIVSKTDFGTGNGWNFTYQSNGLRITFRKNSGATVSDTSTMLGGQVPTSTWTYVAMTYDASTNALKTYINGELKDSRTFGDDWTDSADDLIIGNRLNNGNPSSGNFFNGDIDEVKVYNRVLSGDEIRTHYLRNSSFLALGAITADDFRIINTSGETKFILTNGNVGIGTSTPLLSLDIAGGAILGTRGSEKVTNGDFSGAGCNAAWIFGAGCSV